MTTVLCVFVRGHVAFSPEYVVRLRSMTQRLLPSARFVCLTDDPDSLPDSIETLRIPNPGKLYGWWAKVHLFDPRLPLEGRLVYFDLDVILVRDLESIVNFPAPFALAPDGAPGFRPRGRYQVVKRFNSSVMSWNAGEQGDLFESWKPSVASRLWGDQDWIGEQRADATAMPLEWFPRISQLTSPAWPEAARVVLCKKPKNHIAAQQWPWFNEVWQ